MIRKNITIALFFVLTLPKLSQGIGYEEVPNSSDTIYQRREIKETSPSHRKKIKRVWKLLGLLFATTVCLQILNHALHQSKNDPLPIEQEPENQNKDDPPLTKEETDPPKKAPNEPQHLSPIPMPTVGLKTLPEKGLYCYMFSIVQSLAHVPLFWKFITETPFQQDKKLSRTLQNLFRAMSQGTQKEIDATLRAFGKQIMHIKPEYSGNQMEDPSFFIEDLINRGLHEELKKPHQVKSYNISVDGLPEEMLELLSWKAYLKYKNSPIIDLFFGQYKSNIICANNACQYDLRLFEPFYSLNLGGEHKNNLYALLDHYTKYKTVVDSRWFCQHCKKNLTHSKVKTTLYRLPPILIIHIKKKEMSSNQKMVTYPLEIDLTKYEKAKDMPTKPIYKLCAVTTTIGDYHCTAYGRNEGQWRHFDNLKSNGARKVSPQEVIVNNAYLLFYQRNDKK